jgi:hypothetical protein
VPAFLKGFETRKEMTDSVIILNCSEWRGPVGNIIIPDISVISPENLEFTC